MSAHERNPTEINMATIVSMTIGVTKTLFNCISDYEMKCIIFKVNESVVHFFYIFASAADVDSPCKGLQVNDYRKQMSNVINLQTIC